MRFKRPARSIVSFLFILGLWATPLTAQSAAPSASPITSPTPGEANDQNGQNGEEQPLETLKVNVNLVNIYFNVKDKHGALIPGLTQNDFQLFEDGKDQTIKYFTASSDQPLTLGIMLDTSPSQANVLGIEKMVGVQFLRDVMRTKDEAFLVSFDVDVSLLQDFTNRVSDIRNAMEKAHINGGGVMMPGTAGGPIPISHPKGTLLYDAIYLAGNEILSKEVGRKAMIILTDGEDFGSKMKLKDAVEAAQKADAIVYVLLIADRGGMYQGFGEGEMSRVAAETGGRVVNVGNNQDKLRQAFDEISKELRSEYAIGYKSTNQKHDGTFRKIEIKAK